MYYCRFDQIVKKTIQSHTASLELELIVPHMEYLLLTQEQETLI